MQDNTVAKTTECKSTDSPLPLLLNVMYCVGVSLRTVKNLFISLVDVITMCPLPMCPRTKFLKLFVPRMMRPNTPMYMCPLKMCPDILRLKKLQGSIQGHSNQKQNSDEAVYILSSKEATLIKKKTKFSS
jgi:hypothetical protein